MSFNMRRFFHFFISLIAGLFFVLLGICAILLSLWTKVQHMAISLMQNQPMVLLFFGIGLAIIGLSVLVYGVFRKKRHYNYVRIKGDSITIDESVIHQYLNKYWLEKLSKPIPYTVSIHEKTIHIVADLPYIPVEEQKVYLDGLQHDFSQLFNKTLGYPYDVELLISFGSEPV